MDDVAEAGDVKEDADERGLRQEDGDGVGVVAVLEYKEQHACKVVHCGHHDRLARPDVKFVHGTHYVHQDDIKC